VRGEFEPSLERGLYGSNFWWWYLLNLIDNVTSTFGDDSWSCKNYSPDMSLIFFTHLNHLNLFFIV